MKAGKVSKSMMGDFFKVDICNYLYRLNPEIVLLYILYIQMTNLKVKIWTSKLKIKRNFVCLRTNSADFGF